MSKCDYNMLPEEEKIKVRAGLAAKTNKTATRIVGKQRRARQDQGLKTVVEVYADLVRVRTVGEYEGVSEGGGVRGDCVGFSDDSRRRLIQLMAMWNLSGLSVHFVTLTYPGKYSEDWKTWKRDLDVYVKWLKRACDALIGGIWRVEFQKRGAPHFHLLVATKKPICSCQPEKRMIKGREAWVHASDCRIALFRSETGKRWASIVREGYTTSGGDSMAYAVHYSRHVRAGTQVEVVQGRKQMMAYVSKYLAKTDQANAPVKWGRNWGRFGEMDTQPLKVIEMDEKQAAMLKRQAVKYLAARGQDRYAKRVKGMRGFSVLGLGGHSGDNPVIEQMLAGVSGGLVSAAYLTVPTIKGGKKVAPKDRASNAKHVVIAPSAAYLGVPFLERVGMGGLGVERRVSPGDKVSTPKGVGKVVSLHHCDILHRWRVVVALEGQRYHEYMHLSQVYKLPNRYTQGVLIA